jgi:glycosyltransferase involved in cell wall biosynthesis
MIPRLCVVMPIYNERAHLGATLASLDAQTIPKARVRVVIVDGASTDGSDMIARAWLAASGFAGTLVVNPRRSIPTSLNLGVRLAEAEACIVRLDAHTVYDPTYLAAIADGFAELPERVACVGGAQIPAPPATFDESLTVALMTSRMGLGGASFRHARERKRVDGVYLGAWRPGILARLGGFDERWEANEDAELAARLAAAGGETFFVPAESRYHVKRTALATAAQWRRYGYWRARTTRRHPRTLRARHLAPLAAVVVGAALVVARKPRTLVAVYALYAGAILAAHPRALSRATALASCVYFPVAHVGYALGFARGLATAPPPAAEAPAAT